jgi:hypothetical protein
MSGLLIVSLIRTCLTVVLAGTLICGTVASVAAEDVPAPGAPPQRVLFIGNSHTSRHGGLDWLIGNFVHAEAIPRAYEAESRTSSGATLEYHYENGAREVITSGDFDTVVLQGYLPGSDTRSAEPFLEYARLLNEEIERSGAETVFFMTWPQGRLDWAELDDFVAAHRQISAELDAPVAPVGVAFALAAAERPDLALVSEDDVHATWEGAYLAAATVYATLFDQTPEGLPYQLGLSPDDAAFLQRIAWQAVSDWRAET